MILDLKNNPVYKKTKTFSYMYPMASTLIPVESTEHLVNVFLGDVEYPKLNNHLFLLYRFNGSIAFTEFEDEFETFPSFVKSYDPDKYHVMKVIDIPKDMQSNYDAFKKSMYSKLSDNYKKVIIKHWRIKEDHKLSGVLYKKEFVYKAMEDKINDGVSYRSHVTIDRNQEASSVLDMDKEMYNPGFKVNDALRYRGELNK